MADFMKYNMPYMQISIEVSLYPLSKNFISPFDNFISCLKKYDLED